MKFIFRVSPVFEFTAGPRASFANRDYHATEEWTRYAFVFRVPDKPADTKVHFGQ